MRQVDRILGKIFLQIDVLAEKKSLSEARTEAIRLINIELVKNKNLSSSDKEKLELKKIYLKTKIQKELEIESKKNKLAAQTS